MRKEGRLEIYIHEREVIFHGEMKICEAYDLINYFDKEGYKKIVFGDENSCLRMTKPTTEESHKNDDQVSIYTFNKINNDFLASKKRIKELEDLCRQIMEEYKRPEIDEKGHNLNG